MTTAADDPAVEEAFEAYLAGRPVPEQGAGVAAFAEAVRSSASRPGRPNAALTDLLATGLLTDQSSPSPRTANAAGRPPASRVRIRRRIAMFFPALLAKIASAGAVAQAAVGAGVIVVAFTGAGAAGVLPDSLQHGFATVADTIGIEATDPVESDEDVAPADDTGPDADAPVTGTGEEADPTGAPAEAADLTLEEWQAGPAPDQPFRVWVSEGARHGYADGATISHWAHQKHVDWPEESTATTAPTPQPEPDTAGARGAAKPGTGTSGHGNSASAGDGNAHGDAGRGGGSGHGNR
jgi:hypothetical protein